jgi:hypothetical protein
VNLQVRQIIDFEQRRRTLASYLSAHDKSVVSCKLTWLYHLGSYYYLREASCLYKYVMVCYGVLRRETTHSDFLCGGRLIFGDIIHLRCAWI